jgi:penicillin-binding protein 1A
MSQLLKGSVKIGTAGRIRYRYGLHNEIGGKTGTTQNNSDGWFLGITPEMVLGCWTGADDRAVHFRTTYLGGGANSALPLVGLFLQKAYADKRVEWKPGKFEPPASLNTDISCAPYAVLPPDSIPAE